MNEALVDLDPLGVDQPLARLATVGARSLSNTELLSLVLGSGADFDHACQTQELAKHTLAEMRSLDALARCTLQEAASLSGISLEQAARIVAAGEFGRRVTRETAARMKVIRPEAVCQLLAQEYRGLTRESVRLLLLDTKYQLLRIEEISLGSLNESIAHPREVFRSAVLHSAHAVVLTHNHPSGDPRPSENDRQLTRRIVEAGKVLGIELADHIIFGEFQADGPAFYSFTEEGEI